MAAFLHIIRRHSIIVSHPSCMTAIPVFIVFSPFFSCCNRKQNITHSSLFLSFFLSFFHFFYRETYSPSSQHAFIYSHLIYSCKDDRGRGERRYFYTHVSTLISVAEMWSCCKGNEKNTGMDITNETDRKTRKKQDRRGGASAPLHRGSLRGVRDML